MSDRKLYLGPLTDNRRWNMVNIRADDIFVVTPPKCGTTWMQTIVSLLLSGDPEVEPELSFKMPWVDIRVREMSELAQRLEAMPHRRSMKSHTPLDGLPVDSRAQYICVFRHPLDAHFSFRNHVRNVPLPWFDHWFPEDDPNGVAFRRFLDGGAEGFDMDAVPLAHILQHYSAARSLAELPNVSLFHFADMKRDLVATFSRVAALLDITYPPAVMNRLARAATFENMKQNAERFSPSGGKGFFKSDAAFFCNGSLGNWEGHLTASEISAYDAVMDKHLTPEDRSWLENGTV